MINGLLKAKENRTKRTDKIFLSSSDSVSGRTLMIEEDEYNVLVYVLEPDNAGIDFISFLCTVIYPKSYNADSSELDADASLLPRDYISSFGFIMNLKKKDLTIHWQRDYVSILIKDKVFMILDLAAKVGYSKGLLKACKYGKPLEE